MAEEKMGGLDDAFSEPAPRHENKTRFDAIVSHNYGPLRRIAQIGSRLLGRRAEPKLTQENLTGQLTPKDEENLLKPFSINAPRANETKPIE